MKPGFTMAEATETSKKIKMRKDRITHLLIERERIDDCIMILQHEIEGLVEE